jgi:hypothetical protein
MDIHKVRKLIYEKDGNKCYKCPSTTRLTLDHVNPKFKFHYHGIDNIITLCWECNNLKYKDILPSDELNKIKEYLNIMNQRFTEAEATEMSNVIKDYYNSPRSKRIRKKKEKRHKENWRDIAIPNRDGILRPWTIYRMRD